MALLRTFDRRWELPIMATIGGTTFFPGSTQTISISGLDTTEASANLIEVNGLVSVDGVINGSNWDFTFTADESGVFDPTPNRWDVQVVMASGAVHAYTLITGERKQGTVPSTPTGANQVTSVAAGTGIAASPDPIISTGTISLSAATSDLTDVDSATPTDLRQLVYSASASKYEPKIVDYYPADGSEITTFEKAYDHSSGNYKPLYMQSFSQAINSSGPAGNVVLIASGVEACWRAGGYLQDSSGNKYILPSTGSGTGGGVLVKSDGELRLNRGSTLDESSDGYFITVWYTKTADSGGDL